MPRITRAIAATAAIVPLAGVLLAGPAMAQTDCTRALVCAPVNAPLVDGPLLTAPLITDISLTGDVR